MGKLCSCSIDKFLISFAILAAWTDIRGLGTIATRIP